MVNGHDGNGCTPALKHWQVFLRTFLSGKFCKIMSFPSFWKLDCILFCMETASTLVHCPVSQIPQHRTVQHSGLLQTQHPPAPTLMLTVWKHFMPTTEIIAQLLKWHPLNSLLRKERTTRIIILVITEKEEKQFQVLNIKMRCFLFFASWLIVSWQDGAEAWQISIGYTKGRCGEDDVMTHEWILL